MVQDAKVKSTKASQQNSNDGRNCKDRQDDDRLNNDDNDRQDIDNKKTNNNTLKTGKRTLPLSPIITTATVTVLKIIIATKDLTKDLTIEKTTMIKQGRKRRNKRKQNKRKNRKIQDQVGWLIQAYAFKTVRQKNLPEVPIATYILAQRMSKRLKTRHKVSMKTLKTTNNNKPIGVFIYGFPQNFNGIYLNIDTTTK